MSVYVKMTKEEIRKKSDFVIYNYIRLCEMRNYIT